MSTTLEELPNVETMQLPSWLRDDVVELPARLMETMREFRRVEIRRAISLMYTMIEGRRFQKADFVFISQNEFMQTINRNPKTIRQAVKHLEKNGFITTKPHKWQKTYRGYRVEDIDMLTMVELEGATLNVFRRATGTDPLSEYTRRLIGRLSCDPLEVQRQLDAFDTQIAMESDLNFKKKLGRRKIHLRWSSRNVAKNLGKVDRTEHGGRLFSPYCQLGKEIRPHFLLDNQPMVGIDLSAAQPLIWGTVSEDSHMIADCYAGTFYEKIQEEFSIEDREICKTIFCRLLFGGRSLQRGLTGYLRDKYPNAMKFRDSYPRKKLGRMSIDLQAKESSIFIDGLLRQCQKIALPTLTVHDGAYTTEQHFAELQKIAHMEVAKGLGHKKFKLKRENLQRDLLC